MDKKCGICGRQNVDILCSKCGTFICERCYDVQVDQCVNCSGKRVRTASSGDRIVKLVSGFMLMMMGIFVMSFAFIPLSEARIVIFPFVFDNVNSVSAMLMSLMFFAMFAMTSMIPFYLSVKRSRMYEWDEGIYTLNENNFSGGNVTETMEYMITTEITESLKNTIYLEDNLNEIVLLSEKDTSFRRTYIIPEPYIIDTVESAYEDQFLVLKVKLYKEK
jgi:hypothetical protein